MFYLVFDPGPHPLGDLQGLGGEAFDREHAVEIVGQPAAQVSSLAAHFLIVGLQATLKAERPPQNHWDRQVSEQRHLRGGQGHGATNQNHGGDQLQDLIGASIEKTLELIDVVIQNRQQSAAAVMLKKLHLQLLEMVIGFKAKTVLGRLRQIAPEHSIEIFEQRLATPHGE